jgi:hypothetical protein
MSSSTPVQAVIEESSPIQPSQSGLATQPAQTTVTTKAIQQMIQSALSAMGLLGILSSKWYFDSGASNHMTGTSKSFVSLSHTKVLVKLPLQMG